eukprot:c21408_g1_i3 orf=25-243(+)
MSTSSVALLVPFCFSISSFLDDSAALCQPSDRLKVVCIDERCREAEIRTPLIANLDAKFWNGSSRGKGRAPA